MTPEQETKLLESMARLEDCVVRQQMRLDNLDKTVEAQGARIKALEKENAILKAGISNLLRKAEIQEDKILGIARLERHLEEQAQEHLEQLKQVL